MVFDAERFSRGDRLYVRQLMDEYEAVVRTACASYARSPDHAEDLWQETWLLVLLKGHTYGGRGSFRGWLSRIARNACLSELRAVRTRVTSGEWTPDELRDASPGPLRRLEAEEVRGSVGRALEHLSEREREAVELRVIQGLPTSEVADRLGVRRATVRSHLRHAMNRLRVVLTEEFSGERAHARASATIYGSPRSPGQAIAHHR